MKHIQIYENYFHRKKHKYHSKRGISKIDPSKEVVISINDPNDPNNSFLSEYTEKYTKEVLNRAKYITRGDIIKCPLCENEIESNHGQTKKCICGLEIRTLGNTITCKIDNDELEVYQNAIKYNL